MKIQVKEAGGKGFTLSLPNAMLFSPMVLKLILRSGRHQAPELPPEAVDSICAAIKDYSRTHGPWELVQVESADGDTVVITV